MNWVEHDNNINDNDHETSSNDDFDDDYYDTTIDDDDDDDDDPRPKDTANLLLMTLMTTITMMIMMMIPLKDTANLLSSLSSSCLKLSHLDLPGKSQNNIWEKHHTASLLTRY